MEKTDHIRIFLPQSRIVKKAMSISFQVNEQFVNRHVGPDPAATARMLEVVGSESLDDFITSVIPGTLRSKTSLNIGNPLTENAFLQEARQDGRGRIRRIDLHHGRSGAAVAGHDAHCPRSGLSRRGGPGNRGRRQT